MTHSTLQSDVPEPDYDPPPAPGVSWASLAGTRSAEAMLAHERIAELEAKLASIGKDMPEMLALCEHKDNRIAELEAQLARARAHELAKEQP